MTNILVVTQRFYPPWSDGIVSYARGFVESILEANRRRKDIDITVLSLTDKIWFPRLHRKELIYFLREKPINYKWFYSGEKGSKIDALRLLNKLSKNQNYELIHIFYEDLDVMLARLLVDLPENGSLFKHLLVYPIQKKFVAQKFTYNLLEKSFLKSIGIKFSVSSKVLRKLYGLRESIIIPPAINVELFKPGKSDANSKKMVEILTKAKIKIGNLNSVLSRDIIILYMGPLIPERFHYKSILRSISTLAKKYSIDIGLIAVGRGFEDIDYLREMKIFVEREHLYRRVFFCLKDLTEKEKIHLLNNTSIFIYFFQPKLAFMSVLFPPIALLESMSMGKPVVAGGLPHLDTLVRNRRNGILVRNVKDKKEITAGILSAIDNMKKLSLNARATIEREYSIDKVTQEYMKLLNGLGTK